MQTMERIAAGEVVLPAQLLGTRAVANLLGVSQRTLQDLTHKGAIAHLRVGRQIKFQPSDVQRYIDRQLRPAVA